MARRRSRRRNSGRGNSRGIGWRGRQLSPYTTPVTEPANFYEDAQYVSTASGAAPAAVTLGTAAAGALASAARFRLTSIVVEPVTVQTAAAGGPPISGQSYNLFMTVSGNSYSPSENDKPLRVRFQPEYNGDGQWHTAADLSSTLQLASLDINTPLGTGITAYWKVRLRWAWTDVPVAS